MRDREEDFRTMVVGVDRLLTDERPAWEAVYPKMAATYEAVHQAMAQLSGLRQQLSATGGGGGADAKDTAEAKALDAAMKVVKGLRTVRDELTGVAPDDLVKATRWERSALDALRDTALVDALHALRATAQPYKAALAEERVTAAHLTALETTTAAYAALVGAPRAAVVDASTLRKQEIQHVQRLRRELIPRLDRRMDNLEEDLPELVARYRQLRVIVDTGGGGGKKAEA